MAGKMERVTESGNDFSKQKSLLAALTRGMSFTKNQQKNAAILIFNGYVSKILGDEARVYETYCDNFINDVVRLHTLRKDPNKFSEGLDKIHKDMIINLYILKIPQCNHGNHAPQGTINSSVDYDISEGDNSPPTNLERFVDYDLDH